MIISSEAPKDPAEISPQSPWHQGFLHGPVILLGFSRRRKMKGQFRKLAIQSIASKHGVSFDEATKRYSRLSNREKDKLCQKMQGNYNCSGPSMAELFIEASWNRDPDLDFVRDMMP